MCVCTDLAMMDVLTFVELIKFSEHLCFLLFLEKGSKRPDINDVHIIYYT